jgi:hypothetical protein
MMERMDNNMSNIALNRPADANSSVYPFIPGRSVDGKVTPIYRWMGSSPIPSAGVPAPNWLRVDLGSNVWINRWVVKQMGSLGWLADYNLSDYKLQGSLDNAIWFDLDSVADNSLSSTDRAFTATKVRWVRVYVTKGLRNNTNFASISELEIYDAPATDATLSALSISNGTAGVTLTPSFVKTTAVYAISVGYDAAFVMVTPMVTDPNAAVTVNGVSVPSGQTSAPVGVAAGVVTAIPIVVTPVIGVPQTYTVNVTRASSPYLNNLAMTAGRSTIVLNPNFAKGTLVYDAALPSGTTLVNVTATTEVSNASLKINNEAAISGTVKPVTLTSTQNQIKVDITSGIGTDQKTYLVNLIR